MAAGAAHGNDQRGLSLLRIQGQRESQQLLQPLEEVLCLLKGKYIVADRFVQSRLRPQFFNIEGIWHKAHIDDQVRFQRQTVLVSEGGNADRHAGLLSHSVAEQLQKLSAKLGSGG